MILIIGYGNPLRGDDSLGQVVAAGLERTPGVTVITAPMLVPELAEPIASASAVIFVDARVGTDRGAIHCDEIRPRVEPHALGHVAGPEGLLNLVDELYGRRPSAWVVSVTGADFGFGLDLSAHLFRAVPETIRVVETLVERLSPLSAV